jgi:hypothetical protein
VLKALQPPAQRMQQPQAQQHNRSDLGTRMQMYHMLYSRAYTTVLRSRSQPRRRNTSNQQPQRPEEVGGLQHASIDKEE